MLFAATSGFSRSASENTASNEITTAPRLVRLMIISASWVRGHGHCPSLARLFSSMSTMVTGRAVFTRGSMRWKVSKVRTRSSSSGPGSTRRSAANPIRMPRQISREKPNFRENHRRRILRRFMDGSDFHWDSGSLPTRHYWLRCLKATQFGAVVQPRPRLEAGMRRHDEIARMQVGGDHVLQQKGVLRVQSQQRVVALLGGGRERVRCRVDVGELPQVDRIQMGVEIRDGVLRRRLSRGRREYELIVATIAGQGIAVAGAENDVVTSGAGQADVRTLAALDRKS